MNSIETSTNVSPKYLGMAWYKFLTSFGLIAGAVINFLYSIGYLTGSVYSSTNSEVTAEQVYAYYGETLQTLDFFYGLFIIGFGILAIVLRNKLKDFEPNTMQYVYIFYSLSVCTPLVYLILVSFITDLSIPTSTAISLLANLIGAIVNVTYLKQREHLFVGLTETSNDLVQEAPIICNTPQPPVEKLTTNETNVDDIFFCSRCGTKLISSSSFCHKCGKKMH